MVNLAGAARSRHGPSRASGDHRARGVVKKLCRFPPNNCRSLSNACPKPPTLWSNMTNQTAPQPIEPDNIEHLTETAPMLVESNPDSAQPGPLLVETTPNIGQTPGGRHIFGRTRPQSGRPPEFARNRSPIVRGHQRVGHTRPNCGLRLNLGLARLSRRTQEPCAAELATRHSSPVAALSPRTQMRC